MPERRLTKTRNLDHYGNDALTAPFSAPSAGSPPWYLYRMPIDTAYGVAFAEPDGATRWDFAA